MEDEKIDMKKITKIDTDGRTEDGKVVWKFYSKSVLVKTIVFDTKKEAHDWLLNNYILNDIS